jgi:hypothetical protein
MLYAEMQTGHLYGWLSAFDLLTMRSMKVKRAGFLFRALGMELIIVYIFFWHALQALDVCVKKWMNLVTMII